MVDTGSQVVTTPTEDEPGPSNRVVLPEQTQETVFPKTTKDVSQQDTTTPEGTSEEAAPVPTGEVHGSRKLDPQVLLVGV